jgi:hypothetical protein
MLIYTLFWQYLGDAEDDVWRLQMPQRLEVTVRCKYDDDAGKSAWAILHTHTDPAGWIAAIVAKHLGCNDEGHKLQADDDVEVHFEECSEMDQTVYDIALNISALFFRQIRHKYITECCEAIQADMLTWINSMTSNVKTVSARCLSPYVGWAG